LEHTVIVTFVPVLVVMSNHSDPYVPSPTINSLLLINSNIGRLCQLSLDSQPEEDSEQDFDRLGSTYFLGKDKGSERVQMIDAICCVLDEAIGLADALQINFSGLILHRWVGMVDSGKNQTQASHPCTGRPDAIAGVDKPKSGIANHVCGLQRQLMGRDNRSGVAGHRLLFGPRFFYTCLETESKHDKDHSRPSLSCDDDGYLLHLVMDAIADFTTNGYVHDLQSQWDVFKDHMFWHFMVVRDAFGKTSVGNKLVGPNSLVLKLSGAVGELSAYVGSSEEVVGRVPCHLSVDVMARVLADVGMNCLSVLSLLKREGSSLDPYYGDIERF